MNFLRLRKICCISNFHKFRYASTSAKPKSEIETLPKQDAKITQSSAGITVASIENYAPMSEVSVVLKAGSRYEDGNNVGVVHCLRNCSALSTKNRSAFAITRSLEVLGAKLRVASTREHFVYSLLCNRDDVDFVLEILADVSLNQAFKPWEVNNAASRMHVDLALHESSPEEILTEILHKAAFRGGLSNSLYSPPFMVGKHSPEMLHDFINQNFIASKTSIVGLGVPHDHLKSAVDKLFPMNNNTTKSDVISKFSGGEVRLEADIPFVRAAIVVEGSGLANTKDSLSLAILKNIVGGNSSSKFSCSKYSKLGEAAVKCTSNPFAVSSLNINYSDTGLFGIYIAGHQNDMKQLVKSVVTQLREVMKNISENSVQIAKHQLKTKLHLERDTSKGLLSTMEADASAFKQIRDINELDKLIDDLKTTDIQSVASRVMKTKPAMAAVGRLHSTPYLDELI